MGEPGFVQVVRRESRQVLVPRARWCDSGLCRLRGLQFRRRLDPGEGLILVNPADTVTRSSIHMFFVFFPITAVWIDSQGRITTAQLAKPWRPYYASSEPARYVLECSPDLLAKFSVGDFVDFVFQ